MTWYQAADPEADDDPPWQDPYEPVPGMRTSTSGGCGAGVNYGFMLNTPNRYLFAMDITGPGDFEQHSVPVESIRISMRTTK